MQSAHSEVRSELKKAIFTYGCLRSRLLSAIEDGNTEMKAMRIGKDDECELGVLIYDTPELRELNPDRYERVRRAHREVHKQVAIILSLATSGKGFEAGSLISPKSVYAKASAALEGELTAWCQEFR